jgi:(p)ppGpp synthase/HD superfamily hydrolase
MKKPYYQTEIVQEAHRVAGYYHGLTRALRKGTGFPYIVHPVAVCASVRSYFENTSLKFTDEFKVLTDILSVTHDLFEDTEIPREVYLQKFGMRSFRLLNALTDETYPELKTRQLRVCAKHDALKSKLAALSDEDAAIAAIVKYHDRQNNLEDSFAAHNYKFLEDYRSETKALFAIIGPFLPVDLQEQMKLKYHFDLLKSISS